MKRIFSLLLAGLFVFLLAACGAPAAPALPDADSDGSPALKLDTLNVEFAIGERDADELMRLQAELPPLLLSALENENVTVETVSITFGASAEATAQALEDGSVDVAFLPSEVFVLSDPPLRLIAVENMSVPAGEYFPDIDFAALPDVAADSPIYENIVAGSDDTPVALGAAFSRALVMLCASADGNAVMQRYGSASYLISGHPGTLLTPLVTCLTLEVEE